MPPLRKKGRGGGGGKTEAPLPGEVLGASPSVSASVARKERERRIATTATSHQGGIENLGVFVSRSFQKERGEKKLLEASRTSLHLTSGTFQRSLRARKTEPSSTDSTPRVSDVNAKREEREKRLTESAQRASVSAGYRSAYRSGRDEPAVCRTSCRELGDDKILYRRSLRAGEEKLVRRVARRDEKTTSEYSTRYNSIYPAISAGKGVRESQSVDGISLQTGGSLASQRLDRGEDLNLLRASPNSPALLRKSPRTDSVNTTTTTSPGVSLPVKSSCKCGAFRSTDTGSTPGLQDKLGLGALDDRRRGTSPIPTAVNAELVGKGEKKSRELSDSLQGTPSLRSSSHNSGSATRANTPNLLQGRLALLEGRVSQIAAELKATKELLDANNPACSKAVLTDIQSKISGIEKAINYRLARECGLVDQLEAEQLKGTFIQANDAAAVRNFADGKSKMSGRGSKSLSGLEIVPHGPLCGKTSKAAQSSSRAITLNGSLAYDGVSMSAAEKLSHIASLAAPRNSSSFPSEVGGSAPSSQVKPVFDHTEFEERLFPHQKLLRNRPAVHQKLMENRAALHQKLVENSVLLRNKLAALEERDGVNCGALDDDFEAAEFITSLKHPHGLKERDFERGKVMRGIESISGRALRSCTEEAGDLLFPVPHAYPEYGVDVVITKERRSSREGRRSSGSRKSFSGTPTGKTELASHALERGPGSRNERRRRSSEKRKSISTSECCSPEPIQSASQIVMLEPLSKLLPDASKSAPLRALVADPSTIEPLDLTCREEDITGESHLGGDCEKDWSPEGQRKENSEPIPPTSPPTDDRAINLACEESLSSEDPTDDLQDYVLPAIDDEQPYLGECEDSLPAERLHQIGDKVATAGWFISDGEGVLLAHEDGFCSFYDVANMEGKAIYQAPPNISSGAWRDCWLIRAAGSDGTSNKYVVAASVGSAVDSAFCSWDFYDRRITAFHAGSSSPQASPSSFSFKSSGSSSPERRHFPSTDKPKPGCFSWYSGSDNAQLLKGRTPSGPLSLDLISGGSYTTSSAGPSESDNLDIPLWWYRPCSPLLVSAATGLKTIVVYDVRDGDVVMKWDLPRWVACMEFSSPIQWRNKGKVVVAEDQAVSLWDVNSRTPQRLHNINLNGKEVRALHVRNSDAEFSGGVRQRHRSGDNPYGDGVLCTHDALNVLDFRVPAGIVLKIPTFGETTHSVSANGDSVFAGVTGFKPREIDAVKGDIESKVNEWSIKQGRPMSTYKFPFSAAHQSHQSVAQVWGNHETVMGVNGNGLSVFDSTRGAIPGKDGIQSPREVLGADDLVQPTFDYAGNRVLLISRDRPAFWCHFS